MENSVGISYFNKKRSGYIPLPYFIGSFQAYVLSTLSDFHHLSCC